MSLQTLKDQKGFTIVELLIVIVVIGILAAITIVAYNGIQNRSKTTAGQSLAGNVAKKLEAYNSVNGAYPTTPAQVQGTTESKIDNITATPKPIAGVSTGAESTANSLFSATALDGTSANGGKTVRISGSATGGTVSYWSYTTGDTGEKTISYGSGS